MRTQVEYVVVSLGPYRFSTWSARVPANNCWTKAGLSASPARLIVRTVAGTRGDRNSASIPEGTVLISVSGSCAVTASTSARRYTVAPHDSGTNSSYTARSKLTEVAISVLANSAPAKFACAHAIRLTVLKCSIATPLGRPVEPEV